MWEAPEFRFLGASQPLLTSDLQSIAKLFSCLHKAPGTSLRQLPDPVLGGWYWPQDTDKEI